MQVTPDLTSAPLPRPPSDGPHKEMLSHWQEGEQTVVKINYSSLSLLQSCPRKSYYLLERKLRSKNDSAALIFGTAIHAALELFYAEPRENRNLPANFRRTSDMIPHGGETPEHFLYTAIRRFCEKAAPLQALPDSDKRSLTAGVWLLQNYFETYITDPFVVLRDEQGPVTERRCEALLYESQHLKIILHGTIDVVLRNEQTGVILPTDHKTSSVVGNDFFNRLKPNHQYTGYLFLAQQVLGLSTDSFLVNCLQVKPKPTTARGTAPHFPRQVTRRTPEDIQEFREAVVSSVSNFLTWKKSGIWPLGEVNNCTMYGGCQFLEVCAAPNTLRENILEARFEGTHGTQETQESRAQAEQTDRTESPADSPAQAAGAAALTPSEAI